MFYEHNNTRMSGNAPLWFTYSNWGPHISAPKHRRISTPFSEEGTSPIKGMDFYPLPPAFRRGLISGYMFIEQYVLHFSSNINFEKDYIIFVTPCKDFESPAINISPQYSDPVYLVGGPFNAPLFPTSN